LSGGLRELKIASLKFGIAGSCIRVHELLVSHLRLWTPKVRRLNRLLGSSNLCVTVRVLASDMVYVNG
jgi:hypothetical protein